MFRCNRCGEVFQDPDTKRVTENMDGENGWWTYTVAFCPICGSHNIEETAENNEDEPED